MIRDWRMGHAPSVARYANNRKIWINLRDAFPHPYGLQDAESFISSTLTANPSTVYAIASQPEAIGCIGLILGQDVTNAPPRRVTCRIRSRTRWSTPSSPR